MKIDKTKESLKERQERKKILKKKQRKKKKALVVFTDGLTPLAEKGREIMKMRVPRPQIARN